MERMYLSNTTLCNGRGLYSILHEVQLHVSVLDNGHLQVVHEILIKQFYKTYMGCIHGAGRRGGGYAIPPSTHTSQPL